MPTVELKTNTILTVLTLVAIVVHQLIEMLGGVPPDCIVH